MRSLLPFHRLFRVIISSHVHIVHDRRSLRAQSAAPVSHGRCFSDTYSRLLSTSAVATPALRPPRLAQTSGRITVRPCPRYRLIFYADGSLIAAHRFMPRRPETHARMRGALGGVLTAAMIDKPMHIEYIDFQSCPSPPKKLAARHKELKLRRVYYHQDSPAVQRF